MKRETFTIDSIHDYKIVSDEYSSRIDECLSLSCTWHPSPVAYSVKEYFKDFGDSDMNIDTISRTMFHFDIDYSLIDAIQPHGKWFTYSMVNKSLSGSKMRNPKGLAYDFIGEDGRSYLYPNDRWIAQYPRLFHWGRALRRHVGILAQYHPENEWEPGYEGVNNKEDPFEHCRIEDTALGSKYSVEHSTEFTKVINSTHSVFAFLCTGILKLHFLNGESFNDLYYSALERLTKDLSMESRESTYVIMENEQGYLIRVPIIMLQRDYV